MRNTVVALSLTAMLGLTACAGGGSPTAEPSAEPSESAAAETQPEGDDDVRVIQPGKPGEPTETGPVELPEPEYNDADVAFMTMMIPHHRQALVMSDLAKTRAGDPAVRRMAARIRGAQAPEIGEMSSWLEARGEAVPGPEDDRVDMDMGMDMGMLDADGLLALVDAEGAEFDRLYLAGMMGHHEGAVDMTEQISTDGVDQRVSEIAADIGVGQTAEIGRMEDIEARL